VFHDHPPQEDTHLVMSYSFFDLHEAVVPGQPSWNYKNKEQMDRDFPDLFAAAGELNLHKQALSGNARKFATTFSQLNLEALTEVFEALRVKDFPALIHCDIGFDHRKDAKKNKLIGQIFCCSDCYGSTDTETKAVHKLKRVVTKMKSSDILQASRKTLIGTMVADKLEAQVQHFQYAEMMNDFCTNFKHNKIIWAHLGGLSLELVNMDVREHAKFLKTFLTNHPNVWVDVSWDVIYKAYFDDYADLLGLSEDSDADEDQETKKAKQEHAKEVVEAYLNLFNELPTRFLTGTDCVATLENFKYETYTKALQDTAFIFVLKEGLTDEAFSRIVLGQNYIDVYGDLSLVYTAPRLAPAEV